MPAAKPLEFKRRVVELVREGDEPVAQVARDLGISESGLRRWMAQADVDQGKREGLSSGEKQELVRRRRRYGTTKRDPQAVPSDDLVNRHFEVEGPDRLWVADVTEHSSVEGKVYLAVVIDAWSRRVIGWSIADHLRTELVIDALEMACWRRKPTPGEVIHHADHGSQTYTPPGRSVKGSEPPDCSGHGHRRGLLRQCRDRSVLGSDAGRTTRPATVAHPERARPLNTVIHQHDPPHERLTQRAGGEAETGASIGSFASGLSTDQRVDPLSRTTTLSGGSKSGIPRGSDEWKDMAPPGIQQLRGTLLLRREPLLRPVLYPQVIRRRFNFDSTWQSDHWIDSRASRPRF